MHGNLIDVKLPKAKTQQNTPAAVFAAAGSDEGATGYPRSSNDTVDVELYLKGLVWVMTMYIQGERWLPRNDLHSIYYVSI